MLYQWLVLAGFALALVADHLVFWRGFEHRATLDAAKARRTLWTQWIGMLWTCSALVMWLWIAQDLPVSALASLSAGFCEELLCRGFVIWLFQPLVGWWIAAILSLALFTLAHIYQGRDGMIKVAALGGLMTLIVALCHCLWPAIVLHAAIDLMGGWIGWQIFRKREAMPPALEPLNPR